ncbi:MAG: LysR family transcriptional regulator, partial [Eubacteriales bacterium]|nr:LysR family transcriptional regulator [Eubacteriales bacterium]
MTLQQLKYIVTIADKGKISEAASEHFISQPSLTNAVREVEEELGFAVFNRTNRGISLTGQGRRFLAYARQVVEQMSILENTFLSEQMTKQHFQVSAQHYSFVVNAFVELLKEYDFPEYDVTLRECRTAEIIDDVRNARSQIGVLYLSDFNEKVIRKTLKESHLDYHELFTASPHIFISSGHPLASHKLIELSDLEEYPRLSFE